MSEHIVKSFTEQLEALANAVAQMGGLAEAQFANAIEAIAKRDTKLAECRHRLGRARRPHCSRRSKIRR